MAMPTKEQIESVAEHIRDVIGRNYIEGDGDQASCWFQPEGGGVVGRALFQGAPIGTPEPFPELPSKAKAELLVTCVDWEGFTFDERRDVSRRVIDGESPEFWMDGVQASRGLDPEIEQKIDRFISEKDINGYLSWLTDDLGKVRERLTQVEAYDTKKAEALDNPPVRPLTDDLINAALLDVWPKVPTIVDFGIDSDRHLGALQYAIKYGEVTAQELDAAMGDGAKLTEIIQRGDNPYRDVTFRTSWDEMRLDQAEDHGFGDLKDLFAEMRADEHAARVRDYGEADQRGMTERILFGEILHSTPSPAPQPERPSKDRSRDDDGIEM